MSSWNHGVPTGAMNESLQAHWNGEYKINLHNTNISLHLWITVTAGPNWYGNGRLTKGRMRICMGKGMYTGTLCACTSVLTAPYNLLVIAVGSTGTGANTA